MVKNEVRDVAHTADRCHVCGAMVTFGTENGSLVAYDMTTRDWHPHQPPTSDAAANRERIARARETA